MWRRGAAETVPETCVSVAWSARQLTCRASVRDPRVPRLPILDASDARFPSVEDGSGGASRLCGSDQARARGAEYAGTDRYHKPPHGLCSPPRSPIAEMRLVFRVRRLPVPADLREDLLRVSDAQPGLLDALHITGEGMLLADRREAARPAGPARHPRLVLRRVAADAALLDPLGEREAGEAARQRGPRLRSDDGHQIRREQAFRALECVPAIPSRALDPPGCDLSRVRLKAPPEDDDYCGTAAIRFPYVSAGQADVGRLCRGCEYISRNFDSLPDAVKAQVVPPGVDKRTPLRAMSTRLRSRRGFIQHISSCYGVERLLAESKR